MADTTQLQQTLSRQAAETAAPAFAAPSAPETAAPGPLAPQPSAPVAPDAPIEAPAFAHPAPAEAPAVRTRVWYLDVLRVLAIFGVVLYHTAGGIAAVCADGSAARAVCTAIAAWTFFCVPLLFMISGTLFLDPARTVTLRGICRKNVTRVAVAYVFWSALYAVLTTLYAQHGFSAAAVREMFYQFAVGQYHLWFLYAIIGLYLITPLLRSFAGDEHLVRLFLALWAAFSLVLPYFSALPGMGWLGEITTKWHLDFVTGFTGYFVLGRWLCMRERPLWHGWAALGAGMACFALAAAWPASAAAGGLYGGFLSPGAALAAAGLFLLLRAAWRKTPALSARRGWLLAQLSACSFGVYLVHDFTLILFRKAGLFTSPLPAGLWAPVCGALVFLVSFGIIKLARRVPFVRRWLT